MRRKCKTTAKVFINQILDESDEGKDTLKPDFV